jgi:Ser-tRNA(Ala) deacylase AlaX
MALKMLNTLVDELSFGYKPEAATPTVAPTAAKPSVAVAKAAAAPQAKAAAAKAAAAPAPAPAPAASGEDLPATTALYQTDTYLFTCEASVLAVEELEGGKGWAVVLDETCFHPQGGGQPADAGSVESTEGGAPFAVAMVRKGPTGVVRHEGPAGPPSFGVGAKVRCKVDEPARMLNSRVHTAGHLIDVAMTENGMAEKLRPTKGYHFLPGAYVEYDGKLEAKERDALVPKLQASMDSLVQRAIGTVVQSVEGQKLDTACPPNALPADRSLWGTGWVRVVRVGGLGCPCGGTHVANTSELKAVKVEAIKSKGKVTRVSYTVS